VADFVEIAAGEYVARRRVGIECGLERLADARSFGKGRVRWTSSSDGRLSRYRFRVREENRDGVWI
jgi:hypothetical protein